MGQYSLRTLIESADAFELMRKHRPTDELAEWAKSNVEGGSMSAMAVSDLLSVTINGVPLKSIEARTRSSIEQWIGNGWWKQVNWDAYEASGDPNDFFDLEMYPKQVSPNTFSIKPNPARAKEWQLDTNPDGSYTVEFESYTKTKDDDLANEIHDQLMRWTGETVDGKWLRFNAEEVNKKFIAKYKMYLDNPRVQKEIEDWNNTWQGWPIQIQESKRNNKMKITKRQLKRIIREEISRLKRRGLIRETRYPWMQNKRGGPLPWTEAEFSKVPQEERDAYMDWQWDDKKKKSSKKKKRQAYNDGYEEGLEGYKEDLPGYLQQMKTEGYSEDELDNYRRGFEDGLQADY